MVQEEVVVRELGRAGLALVDPLRRLAPVNPQHVVVQDRLKIKDIVLMYVTYIFQNSVS